MTGALEEIAAFLQARYDEEEQTARAALEAAARNDEPGVVGYAPAPWSVGDEYRSYDGGWPVQAGHLLVKDVQGERTLPKYVVGPGWEGGGAWDRETAEHIARWDPVRVLADVEAKRQILWLHGRMSIDPGHPQFNDAHLTKEPMVICRSCEPERMFRRTHSWPCRTLRALALPYANHPAYREEWRL